MRIRDKTKQERPARMSNLAVALRAHFAQPSNHEMTFDEVRTVIGPANLQDNEILQAAQDEGLEILDG